MTREVTLPKGYFISYEGEFQAQQEASRRILLMSLLVLLIMMMLLYAYFGMPVFVHDAAGHSDRPGRRPLPDLVDHRQYQHCHPGGFHCRRWDCGPKQR